MSSAAPHTSHSHHHHPTHELVEANRQHFDSQAHVHGNTITLLCSWPKLTVLNAGYDANPVSQLLAKKCGAAILKASSFDEDKTVVMDYACGTGGFYVFIFQREGILTGLSGLLSQALAPHTRTLIGVDISPKSVAYYNERVANQGISKDEMRAVCVELSERGAEEVDAFDGVEFDVIVVSQVTLTHSSCASPAITFNSQCTNAYHHFDDIAAVTKTLVSYLKPGSGILLVVDLLRSSSSESLHKDHGK
jgi:SAM-dependent methyltransferase